MSEAVASPLVSFGPLSPHFVFEALAYAVGFRVFVRARRARGDVVGERTRWSVVVAAILGAALGAKALALAAEPALLGERFSDPRAFFEGGKTIVGALLGGWLAVEATKRVLGERRRTGDLFAVPLALGIALGRVGCFLTGLADRTCGVPTSAPVGIDFGDGVPRHPTQLYEIAFLVPLALLLARAAQRPHVEGALFRRFLGAYLAFRLVVDFAKPPDEWPGLSAIQSACLGGLALLALDWPRPAPAHAPAEVAA